jgi:hypothetical protein
MNCIECGNPLELDSKGSLCNHCRHWRQVAADEQKFFRLTDKRPWYKQVIAGILLSPIYLVIVSVVYWLGEKIYNALSMNFVWFVLKMMRDFAMFLGFLILIIWACIVYNKAVRWARRG